METILRAVSLEPMEITYLGIGSSPHLAAGQTLAPKYDQLIPQCFHEFLIKDKKHMRIVHFDPDFAHCVEFLHQYFESWNLMPMEYSQGLYWMGETLEVFVIPEQLDHTKDYEFFQKLCDTIVKSKGKLLIQEYTGYDLKSLNQKLYDAAENKELFKRRVLLDMTYGTDIGCSTDMTKAQPFYDFDLNFLNLHFMTDKDAKRWIHASLKLDEILRKKYVYKYLSSLNSIHVDYRRRLKGESLMYGSDLYTNDATPDEIMSALQMSLKTSMDILVGLQFLNKEHEESFQKLCSTYTSMDPYKWYEVMRKVIPLP